MIGLRFGAAHVLETPSGVAYLAGAVPLTPRTVRFIRLGTGSAEARSAVMGGRVVTWRGVQYGWAQRGFRTARAARRAVQRAGGRVL
jgi:hypothetical protein